MLIDKLHFSGIIPTKEKNVIFYADEHNFHLMTDELYSPGDDNVITSIKTQDGFIYGRTHNSHQILIYLGKKQIDFTSYCDYIFSSYVLSTSNIYEVDMSMFDSIEFVGGTLEYLFYPCSLDLSPDDSDFGKIETKDDSITCEVCLDGVNVKITIGTQPECHWDNNGTKITNSKVKYTLTFGEPQKLEKVYRLYHKTKELLSFLTDRKNVGFDEINICRGSGTFPCFAQLVVKEDYLLTNKDKFSNICFEDIKDYLQNLIELIYNSKDKKRSVSLGFYPDDDKSKSIINDNMVKAICSALECELGFADYIKCKNDDVLMNLIDDVKSLVKKHEKCAEQQLASKTYDMIFGSIRHWDFSLTDKLWELFEYFKNELLLASEYASTVNYDLIHKFVKYRNDITHGSYRVMDKDVALVAQIFKGLVYCCLLKRIGLPIEIIDEFCKTKILK